MSNISDIALTAGSTSTDQRENIPLYALPFKAVFDKTLRFTDDLGD